MYTGCSRKNAQTNFGGLFLSENKKKLKMLDAIETHVGKVFRIAFMFQNPAMFG
jgi:hypothetical protein